MSRGFRAVLLLVMLVVLASACGNDKKKAATSATPTSGVPTATATLPAPTPTPTMPMVAELEAVGVGKYLDSTSPASMDMNGDWEDYHYDPTEENAICLGGTEFQAFIRRGTSNKVVLFLEGGGACWNDETCWVKLRAKKMSAPLFGDGVLNATAPGNPFADWNVVYVPYCDGSVFSGDNVVDYPDGPTHTYHHGAQNLSAGVSLMRREFPNPELIVVSGSSAGGYGTFSGYGVTRVAYPETPVLVLDDCGPGIQNTARAQDMMDRNQNWRYRQFIPTSCSDCDPQATYLAAWALERDPTLRLGLFDYLQDPILRSFLGFGSDLDGFANLLLDVTNDIHDRYPDRFKRFFKQGESHTILFLSGFYDLEIAGTSLVDWTTDFITDGPAWQDIVEPTNPFEGFQSERYSDPDLWLCLPGKTDDQCLVNSIDATVVEPDNSVRIETFEPPAKEPDIDCFYIYPTVDLSGVPGNHTDFSDISYELDPLLSQAARFTSVCRVFAPLYRQVTFGSFNAPNAQELLDIAYADVDEAFRHYMGQYNNGRRFVIMGHSQGTFMVTRLMRDYIDPNPDLRARLVAGLLIGGSVTVPEGQKVGGTFQNVPLCTSVEQTGCVIAYRSYADSRPPANGSNVVGPEGMDTACTNPAALGGGPGLFKKTYLPLHANQPVFDIAPPTDFTTLFALYENFYSGECVKDNRNRSYLEISITPGPGDLRENMVPFNNPLFAPGLLGTHVLDYNFALGDLIDLVAAKAAATE